MSFIVTNREQKADIGISSDMQQSSGLYFQDEEIVQEEAIIEYKAEYSDSIETETDNDYMMPAADTESASIIYDKELELIIGEEERVLIDSNFGKNAEICYYDLQGNIINKDVLKTELISSENGICLKLIAVKPGAFTVELLNEDYVYRIKVVISEE